MSYTPKTWVNGETIYASSLNNMESGIAANDSEITYLKNALDEKANIVALTWEKGGIDNANGQTNNDGSNTRSRVVSYIQTTRLYKIENNCPSAADILYLIFYDYDADNETYIFKNSVRVDYGTNYLFTGKDSVYIRLDLRAGLAKTSNIILSEYDLLTYDVLNTKNTITKVYCRNLFGGDVTKFYPCEIKKNDYVTMSMEDGENTGESNVTILLYGESFNKIDQFNLTQSKPFRTFQHTQAETVRYLTFNKVPAGRRIQVEMGKDATPYQEYFPNIEYLNPFTNENIYALTNSWNSALHVGGSNNQTACENFSNLMSGDTVNNVDAVAECEAFLFFTDPHTMYGSWTTHFEPYMGQIQKVYRSIPASFALCGGDWLGNSDTPSEAAYKLGLVGATCKSMFDKCYMLVGNHDTNNQGKKDSESVYHTTRLPIDSLKNLWYDGNNAYYKFMGRNTMFYCFDTETGDDTLSAFDNYGYEQAEWFATSLLSETADHIAIALHVYYADNDETIWCPLTHLVMQIAAKYNTRGSIEVNGNTYDFSSATKKVEFAIAGHTHFDSDHIFNEYGADIPVVITTDCGNGATFPTDATFDLVFVDYDNRQIKCIRVGSGSDRTFNLDS